MCQKHKSSAFYKRDKSQNRLAFVVDPNCFFLTPKFDVKICLIHIFIDSFISLPHLFYHFTFLLVFVALNRERRGGCIFTSWPWGISGACPCLWVDTGRLRPSIYCHKAKYAFQIYHLHSGVSLFLLQQKRPYCSFHNVILNDSNDQEGEILPPMFEVQ